MVGGVHGDSSIDHKSAKRIELSQLDQDLFNASDLK